MTGLTDFIESSHSNEASVDWATLSEELEGKPAVAIYPNPTNGIIMVETSLAVNERVECRVFNTVGQEVMRQVGDAERMNLDITALPDGAYYVRIVTPRENKTVKVVKIQ